MYLDSITLSNHVSAHFILAYLSLPFYIWLSVTRFMILYTP